MPRGPKPIKGKLKKMEFYCLSCRKRVKCDDDGVKMRNVRNKKVGTVKMMSGYCAKCEHKVNKIVKKSMKL